MWLLVGGRGGEIDISVVAKKFARCREKLALKCGSSGGVDCRRRSSLRKPNKTVRQDILYRIPHDFF